MSMIKLETKDSKVIEVDRTILTCSKLLDGLLKSIDPDETSTTPIPLAKIESNLLKIILDWAEHHQNDQNDSKPAETENAPSDFDRKFIAENEENLFEIMNAAHFLDIEPLLGLLCKHIASKISNKSVNELRDEFGIYEKKPNLPEE